jgi:hypothetical protein
VLLVLWVHVGSHLLLLVGRQVLVADRNIGVIVLVSVVLWEIVHGLVLPVLIVLEDDFLQGRVPLLLHLKLVGVHPLGELQLLVLPVD